MLISQGGKREAVNRHDQSREHCNLEENTTIYFLQHFSSPFFFVETFIAG
jgi:hypothetical protein